MNPAKNPIEKNRKRQIYYKLDISKENFHFQRSV